MDLGCGGGLDVFLAAKKVGPTGRAIGIDMTPEMIGLSRRNAEAAGVANAEFHLGTIDAIPSRTRTVDVVISNCVINLAPDKDAVFREIARVLKPGGRVAVRHRPKEAALAGDRRESHGLRRVRRGGDPDRRLPGGALRAGFADVVVIDDGQDLNAYSKVGRAGGLLFAADSRGVVGAPDRGVVVLWWRRRLHAGPKLGGTRLLWRASCGSMT